MKLHLGCGKRKIPMWKHIDAGDYDHLDGHDITILPYSDNSVDIIYSSHTLEYFDREEVVDILNEWCRVLKHGGIIRLAVPNFETMAMLYCHNRIELDRFLGPLYGKMQPIGYNTIYHKTCYDFQSLKILLESVGFANIRKYNWRTTEHSHIDDHSQAHLPHMDKKNGMLISLNVEGTKI